MDNIIYEIPVCGNSNWIFSNCLFICLFMVISLGNEEKYVKKFGKGVAIFLTVITLLNYVITMGSYYFGNVESVDGVITDYKSESQDSSVKWDSFCVDDVKFEYRTGSVLGFDNQESGVIYEGMYVEVHYVKDYFISKNVIVQIEYAE